MAGVIYRLQVPYQFFDQFIFTENRQQDSIDRQAVIIKEFQVIAGYRLMELEPRTHKCQEKFKYNGYQKKRTDNNIYNDRGILKTEYKAYGNQRYQYKHYNKLRG